MSTTSFSSENVLSKYGSCFVIILFAHGLPLHCLVTFCWFISCEKNIALFKHHLYPFKSLLSPYLNVTACLMMKLNLIYVFLHSNPFASKAVETIRCICVDNGIQVGECVNNSLQYTGAKGHNLRKYC